MSDASASNSRLVLWPMYVVVLGLIAAFSFVAWRNNRLATSAGGQKKVGVERTDLDISSPVVLLDDYSPSDLHATLFPVVSRRSAIL